MIMHGDRDRITSAAASADFAERARPLAKQLTYVSIHNDGHAMLRRARLWHAVTAGYTVETLLGRAPAHTFGTTIDEVVGRARSGSATIEV
jgi:hypothetical protein